MSEGVCGYLRILFRRSGKSDAGISRTAIVLGTTAMRILRHTMGIGTRPANESAPSIRHMPPQIGTRRRILVASGGSPLRPQDVFAHGQPFPHSTYCAYESKVDTPLLQRFKIAFLNDLGRLEKLHVLELVDT